MIRGGSATGPGTRPGPAADPSPAPAKTSWQPDTPRWWTRPMDWTRLGPPLDVRPLFPVERAAPLDLLAPLEPGDRSRPGAAEPLLLRPVLDTFLRALPHTLRDAGAPEGAAVLVRVSGPAGGRWTATRRAGLWTRCCASWRSCGSNDFGTGAAFPSGPESVRGLWADRGNDVSSFGQNTPCKGQFKAGHDRVGYQG